MALTSDRLPAMRPAAVVLVGERKDSQAYVSSKKKGCAEVGFESFGTDLSENASEEMVLKVRMPLTCPSHAPPLACSSALAFMRGM